MGIGTPWEVKAAGKILCLEDVDDGADYIKNIQNATNVNSKGVCIISKLNFLTTVIIILLLYKKY